MAHAYLDAEGKIVRNAPDGTVYVSSEEELDLFAGETPGTLALQYGGAHAWQLKPDGSWEALF